MSSRRLRRDDGVALTVAIFTMAVIALFSALVASTAVNVGDTSNRDRDSKRALGAAEAGINTALHRLNLPTSAIDNLGCLTDIAVGVQVETIVYDVGGLPIPTHPGQCPGASGRAGNGGEWTYWITLLNNGQHCDEQYTTQTQVDNLLSVSIGGISVLRRCITAIGVVNGVSRRLQREIYSEFRLFYGLIATGPITARSGANLGTSHVGSNGLVTMESGSTYAGQVELQNEAPPEDIQATGQWGVTRRADPWILDPVDFGDVATNNDNGTMGCVGPLLDLLCLVSGNNAYIESGGRLLVPAGYTVTMPAGDYYFCEFRVSGGTVVVTGEAHVFIGDCGGGFQMQGGLLNTVNLISSSTLQIYVGDDDDVTIAGGALAQANLALHAPLSKVTVDNAGAVDPLVKGSISAREIEIEGGTTFVGDPLLDITTPFEQIAGKWHPGKWSECPAEPTVVGDPHSGCNG